jgi:large subunit ribosomal protein L25
MGKTPGILYGRGEDSIPILVDAKELAHLLSQFGSRLPIIEVQLGRSQGFRAVVKAVQRNPVNDELLHIDLQRIHPKEAITVEVPVDLVGEPPGVKMGGLLDQHLHEVPIRGLSASIPERIEVLISELKLGHSIHLKDLNLQGFEVLLPPDTPIVSVLAPKRVEVVTPVEAPAGEETPPLKE